METWSCRKTGVRLATLLEGFVPVLVDIYAEPLVSQICNVYPINKPVISIPRLRIQATTGAYDGSSETTKYIPTSTELIRANEVKIDVPVGTSYNLYTGAGVNSKNHKINRRYNILKKLTIEETPGGGGTQGHAIEVNFRPDARDQIAREFTFVDSEGETVTGNVHVHINNDTGMISVQVNFEGGHSGASYECTEVRFHFRFRPVGTNAGRTIVTVKTEMIDCHVDPNEDQTIH